MLKYIAIFGSNNSGIKTLEEAQSWAGSQLQNSRAIGKAPGTRAFICAVMQEVRVPAPEIEIIAFEPETVAPKKLVEQLPAD